MLSRYPPLPPLSLSLSLTCFIPPQFTHAISKPPSIFFVSLISVSMLGNCEKMVVIPPTNNQWLQIGDQTQKISPMGSGGGRTTTTMEKPSAEELQQQQQQSLKCPRCDSTNTKFCYYNNYSLSQPRHFCKSCKRYWTRGGTLRNVPVGGGCRKNKRVKRQTPSAADHTTSSSSSSPSAAKSNLPSQPHINNHVSPLFYGLSGNSNSDMNLPFPRFSSGYDHLNALGLGFSSGYSSNDSLFSNYSSLFGSSIFCGSSSAISSLLGHSTNLQQQKFMDGGGGKDDVLGTGTFQGLDPLEEVKVDEERPNQVMEHGSLFDYYSPYYWSDQTNNVGTSVTSMIE